jgi:hypothetical protein
MEDPLSVNETEHFFELFETQVKKNYESALNSGAIDKLEPHDHTLLKAVIIITAEQQTLSNKGKSLLENLRHFI